MTPKYNDLLLIIDVQNDFCPGGKLAVPGGDEIVPAVNRLQRLFSHVGLTQDWHPADHVSFARTHDKEPFTTLEVDYGTQVLWPAHCVQDTPGAEFHPDLDPVRAEFTIRKGFRRAIDSYSAFMENDGKTPTGLAGMLGERGFQRIFMVGLALDFCVHWSAIDARKAGFECVVIEDATRAINANGSLEAAMAAMQEAGVAILKESEIRAE